MNKSFLLAGLVSMLGLCACSHELAVKNMHMYQTPVSYAKAERPLNVAVLPFRGSNDDLFFYNALLERMNANPMVASLTTDYVPGRPLAAPPDLVLGVRPSVRYRSSFVNFFVNWPGFIILTPTWNGYVYRADILTTVELCDADGRPYDQLDVPVSYNLRHADADRTIFTGLTWLEVSSLALFGGIYNAMNFDRDVIPPLQLMVKDSYGQFIAAQLNGKLQNASLVAAARDKHALEAQNAPPETIPAAASGAASQE
jgi:hypothetical protein